jgi:hypothetical protein
MDEPTSSHRGIPSVPKETWVTIQLLSLTPEVLRAPAMVSNLCNNDMQWSRRYPGGVCFTGRSMVSGESSAQMNILSDSQAANQAAQKVQSIRPACNH